MSKKIMKRSLALGALMAFVITGSAMAAPEYIQEDSFDSITVEGKIVNGERNVLVYQTDTNTDVVVNDDVKYIYKVTTNSGEYSSESKVVAQSSTETDKNVTFNKNVYAYLATDAARTMQGKGSVFGIDVWQGLWNFNGQTDVEVHSTGNANGSAMGATGVRFWGNGENKIAVGNFNGKTVVKVTTVDASDGKPNYDSNGKDKNDLTGLPGFITGVYVGTHSALVSNDEFIVDVQSTGTVEDGNLTDGATTYGVSVIGGAANFNAKTEIKSVSIQGQAYGMSVKSNGYTQGEGYFQGEAQVELAGDTTIDVTGAERAVGIYAEQSSETVNTSLTGKNITINATATELARGVVAKNTTVVLGGNESKININLDGGNQLLSDGSSNPSVGIWAWKKDADVTVDGQMLNISGIVRDDGDMYGIIAQTTTLGNEEDDKAKLAVNSTDTHINIVDASGNAAGSAIVAMSEGKVDMAGNVYAAAKNAVVARGNAIVGINAENDKDKTIQLDGDVYFAYATNSGSTVDAAVEINLANSASYLNGKIVADSEPPADGKVTGMKLGLSNGATWNVTGDSFVNELNGSGGNIVFDANTKDVHIDAGTASLNLTMKDKTADDLNDAAGLTTVAERLGVSKDATETISAKVVMAEGDVKGETTGVVTYVAPEEGADDAYYHGEVKEVTEKVNTKNQSIGEAGVSLKLHWRSHMNDMNKRMGELRNVDGEHGVWARVVRGESEYKNTKAQYNQYQLGYDEKLSVDERWTFGAAVTFADGDSNYGYGSTEDKSTAFAIYGTKLNNDGTFVDLIARYAHLESDYDDANSGKGDYSTNGMSVSAEFGKRIQQGNGLWVEPQFELTYGNIDSAEFQIGGKTVQVGDMDSLIGRVGFSLGKDIKQGNVYARASYLYDFDGETENAFSNGTDSRTIAEDLGGGWWEVGVGANINLSKATYIYADVEKTFGGEVDTNWQWNLGVRYSF